MSGRHGVPDGQHRSRRYVTRRLLGVAAAVLALGGIWTGFSLTAGAATGITAKTYIANHPDGGHGTPATWAYDDFTRTLTVTLAATSNCTAMSGFNASTDNCYTATIADNGKFNAVVGAGSPSGAAGVQINHAVQGTMVGNYDLTVYAPAADALSTTGVPGYRNDNFGTPATSTTDWPKLAFSPNTGVTVAGGDYTWTYTDSCQKWVDSSANGDGTINAGNITGQDVCVVSVAGPGLVQNAYSHKCLNIVNGVYAQGGTVSQYNCGAMWHGKAGGAQQFEYIVRNNGTGALLAVSPDNGSKWYVNSSTRSAQLTLSAYYNGNADVVRSGSYYQFPNTGLVADDAGYGTNNGQPVIGYPATGGRNQFWSLP